MHSKLAGSNWPMSLDEVLQKDKALSQRAARWGDGRFRHALVWVVARTGDNLLWLAIAGVLIWQGNGLGWQLLTTALVTAVVTAVVKGIVKRPRPAEKWAIATDKYAFPSGHAARAGAIAVTLAFAFPPFTPLLLLWMLLVAAARVALARHFVSDVLGGLALGVLLGLILQLFF